MNLDGLLAATYGKLNVALPNQVFDHVPQQQPYPYVNIGDLTGVEYDTDDKDGGEITITVHTWSRARGMKELAELMDAVYAALHNQSFAVAGEVVVLCYFEFVQTMTEPDGLTRHGVQRFRFITQET
jgi:hypothetical protein